MTSPVESPVAGFASSRALSGVVVPLLKGVVYRENDAVLWNALLEGQARVRDYVAVLGLELVLDEAEGHAFVRSRPDGEAPAGFGMGEAPEGSEPPRLVARRPLSFPVSLLLALLRKKLAELDAGGGDTRLVLARDEIVEMVRVFLPDTSNEARLVDRIDAHINRIVDLGFLRRMKADPVVPRARSGGGTAGATFEVRRILKAFVDAQWLADFDSRLAAYRTALEGGGDGAHGREGARATAGNGSTAGIGAAAVERATAGDRSPGGGDDTARVGGGAREGHLEHFDGDDGNKRDDD